MSNSPFPTTYSTLSCNALITNLLPHYGITNATNCLFWKRGLSDIYLVETLDKSYVLRISHAHWRSKSEIDFELELLDFLYKRFIPVAHPIPTQDGQLSLEIDASEGKRYASLFTFASGKVPLGDLNKKQATKLGTIVANLHLVSQDFRCQAYRHPLSVEYLLSDSLQKLTPFLHSDVMSYVSYASNQIQEQVNGLSKESPFWGICWGDPHSGNAHFTDQDEITLFDFDQCGYGWRAFDVAKFLQVALQAGICPSVREAFLAGYQSVQPLSAVELSSLQALAQTAHIWSWAISVNYAAIHNHSKLDRSFFYNRLEHLKMLRSPDWK